nr:ELMO domain-containing protein A-like isoform X1 [Ipomoea batatas]
MALSIRHSVFDVIGVHLPSRWRNCKLSAVLELTGVTFPIRGRIPKYQFSEVVAGSAAWLGRGLSCVCAQRRVGDARLIFDLTPTQAFCLQGVEWHPYCVVAECASLLFVKCVDLEVPEMLCFCALSAKKECLQRLHNRIDIAYDSSIHEHQEALMDLWNAAFPGVELCGLISEQWKEMGWQGKDPSTDFRGGGLLSLENLLYFARIFPKSFQDLLHKLEGNRSIWEYPFAVAGVNITFMLIQMLDLEAKNESAFDLLYCIAFKMMDQQWLAMGASYMDFNVKFIVVTLLCLYVMGYADSYEGYTAAIGKGDSPRRCIAAGRFALIQPS